MDSWGTWVHDTAEMGLLPDKGIFIFYDIGRKWLATLCYRAKSNSMALFATSFAIRGQAEWPKALKSQ